MAIVVSVSDDSASLARRHSSRRRAIAASVAGSFGSIVAPSGADHGHDPGEERLVEVDAAEALHALGPAELLEPVVGLAQDGRVEGAATEVVDGDHGPGGDAFLAGVVDRRRLGLGQERDVVDVGLADGLLEQVDLVRAVARRVGDDDRIGRAAHLARHARDDRLQQMRDQRLGSVWRAAEDDRGRIAQAALELARGPGRLSERAALGGVAGQDLAVGAEHDDRRDGRRAFAELEDLDALADGRGGRRVGRPEIDPERVRHRASPRSPLPSPEHTVLLSGRCAEGTLAPMTTGLDTPRDAVTAVLPDPSEVAEAVNAAIALADARGRDDLAERLRVIADRVARTDTVVCVVGEFKKGKSALINALIGSDVCPVDDDLATMAVTVVRHSTEPGAVVRRRDAGELIVEAIPADEAGRWVAERDGDERRAGVELVEVGIPNEFLGRGIALVDTPGVGGLNAAHAAATLAFLPSADALVFVTDASTELSGPELEFLASARSAGPPILVAVTKVDIYPAWRRIVDIDAGRLEALGLADAPYPLSSVLRTHALATGDDELETESGYPVFARALADDAVGRARAGALATAVRAVVPVLDQLREPLAAEQAVLDHPETAEALTADLRAARARLAALADADASWSVRLEDEYTSLRSRTGFAFQARMRQLQRTLQEDIDKIDPAREWPAVSQRIQAETAAAVRAAFLEATDGAAAIQATIARLLADEASALEGVGTGVSFDVATLWQGGPTLRGTHQAGRHGQPRDGRRRDGRRRDARDARNVARRRGGRACGDRRRGGVRRQGSAGLAPATARGPAPAGTLVPRHLPRGGPVRGRGPPGVAPRRPPATDARPVRGPDRRASSHRRRDRRRARISDGPGRFRSSRTARRAGRRAGLDRCSRGPRSAGSTAADPVIRRGPSSALRCWILARTVCYSQRLASCSGEAAGGRSPGR